MIRKSIARAILLITILPSVLSAQVSKDSELFKTLKAKDSLLFEVGFNQCDMNQFEKLLTEKLEFYHDKDGMITSKDAFIKTLQKNLCSTGKNTTKRILVEESLEVYALYENGNLYGALQKGTHQFGNTTAQFTHLWLIEKGQWTPKRMISYDHKMSKVSNAEDVSFIKLSKNEMSLYLGDYKFSPDFTLSIIAEGEKLYGDSNGEKAEIKSYGNHQFLDESETMKLRFIVDQFGKTTGLAMSGPDGEMIAKKVN